MTTTCGARWLLGLLGLMGCAWLAACAEDAGQAADTATGDSAADTSVAETTVGETAVDETAVDDTAVNDTAVVETAVNETSAVETAAETAPETTADSAPDETSRDTTATDTPADTDTGPAPEPTPFNVKGAVTLVEQYSDGAGMVVATYIRADFGDRPLEYNGVRYFRAVADGACATWNRPAQPACEPACAETEACVAPNTCEPYGNRLSAGVITIGGTVPSGFTLTPEDGFYVATPETSSDDLFTAGGAITVSAAGGDVPAFDATLKGVGDLTLTAGTGLVELVDGTPFTLSWNPSDVGGSQIEVVLQLGWHGNPPTSIILCHAPDADGQLVITPPVIAEFSYFSGFGLFQVMSWMDRTSRVLVPTPGGTIAVSAASRRNLSVSHVKDTE